MAEEYQLSGFMLVASVNSTDTQHFSALGEQRTVCGIDRQGWMVMRAAVPKDVDSAYTCRNCIRALANAVTGD